MSDAAKRVNITSGQAMELSIPCSAGSGPVESDVSACDSFRHLAKLSGQVARIEPSELASSKSLSASGDSTGLLLWDDSERCVTEEAYAGAM